MNSEFTIAIHSLTLLAYRPDHMATSDVIASNVCTHPARVRKVMSRLRSAGYIQAKEGAGGGFMLAAEPSSIKLGDIFRLMASGSLKPGWCSGDPDQPCAVASNITGVMEDIFNGAENVLIEYFQQLTVADLLDRIRQQHLSRSNPV